LGEVCLAVFISVLEGESPSSATPILATRDPRVVAAVARELAHILGTDQVPARVLSLRHPSDPE